MVQTELAWAAGFFDGEGSIVYKTQHYTTVRGVERTYPALVLSVSQTDDRPLYRFKTAVEIGNVIGPYRNGGSSVNKPLYYWRVEGKQVAQVWRKLLPYLARCLERVGDCLK